jgi:hypothetical protein
MEDLMAAIAHLGIGFAAKRFAPKVHILILLLATDVLDILWAVFTLVGLESMGFSPWTHSLFMSIVWSLLAGLIFGIIYRNYRTGIFLGALVLSHWVLDFITHPMGAVAGGQPLRPDLPLFFQRTPLVGLGLYNHSFVVAIATDLGMFILGLSVYVIYKSRNRRASRAVMDLK